MICILQAFDLHRITKYLYSNGCFSFIDLKFCVCCPPAWIFCSVWVDKRTFIVCRMLLLINNWEMQLQLKRQHWTEITFYLHFQAPVVLKLKKKNSSDWAPQIKFSQARKGMCQEFKFRSPIHIQYTRCMFSNYISNIPIIV